jgi:hypothetical protein
MSRAALLLLVPALFACTKKAESPVDTTTAAAPETTTLAPTPMNVAGTWTFTVMPADKDTTLLVYSLDATNDMTGWKITLPNRAPMDVKVISMDNDSIVIENGPYKSVLQKGVNVTTHSAMHMEGDKLVGTTIAHYDTKGADSVRMLRTSGVRK